MLHLDVVVKSPSKPTCKKLQTFCAIMLGALAMYGAACKPIQTSPDWSSIAMAASPYSGASNGTTFRAVET